MTRAQQQTVLQALADVIGMVNGGVIIPEVVQRSQMTLVQALAYQESLRDAVRELGLRTTVMVQTVETSRNGGGL